MDSIVLNIIIVISAMIGINYLGKNRLPGLTLPKIEMSFLNGGKIEIPNEFGGYVVASGCGSGKTTLIKEIIKDLGEEGILYSAATIEECNDIFKYCVDLCNNERELKSFNINDIMLLHSGNCPIPELTDKFNEWRNIYRNNPEEIQYKRIVICTHHKLFNTNPVTFLGYKGNPIKLDLEDFSPIERGIMSHNTSSIRYYPRQLILIDELPTCETFEFNIDPVIVKSIGEVVSDVYYDESEPDEKYRWKSRMHYPKTIDKPRGFKRFNMIYNTEISGTKFEPIIPSDDKSRDLLDLAKGLIYDNYDELSKGKDSRTIKYNISDFVLDRKMETRIILFDGTGDLTFVGSRRFRLLTFKDKYNSPINIEKFENHLERKIDKLDDSEIELKIFENTKELNNIISKNNKTLIVTWMNLKPDENNNKKKKSNKFQITSKYLNEDLRLPEVYSNNLKLMGCESGFEIIHYMSGLDKATNQFRDYDSIVFLGKFRVPNYAVGEFNRDFRVNTNTDNYSLYQLIQAITRTRIRNHKGEPINIYFSNDWDNDMINLVKDYLSNKDVKNKNVKETYSDMMNHIKPKWRGNAEVLMEYDENFKDSILRNQGYYLEIELSKIYELIPMKEKQVRSYYPMINYFRKLGIDIDIIVDKENNNQYTINREE